MKAHIMVCKIVGSNAQLVICRQTEQDATIAMILDDDRSCCLSVQNDATNHDRQPCAPNSLLTPDGAIS